MFANIPYKKHANSQSHQNSTDKKMPPEIVECIANYSDGRRPEVIEAIAQAIVSVPGVAILDKHSDGDHNRSVITFVGSKSEIEEAAYRSIAKAAALINLDEHTGEHPRIGASDVVPFVPIAGVSMQDCITIANRLGERVGRELGIPVYLYEQAATRPERQNLENIRRGQYEGLKTEIGSNPDRQPDYGPTRLGSAGATVIGARHPLIAFNVYLTTDDLAIASRIARAVRHSSGGLRYVKALEMFVDGRAQVSMNLTNFQQTPLARVVELIRREAQRYGVSIHHSELVGLIPQAALNQAATWYLQLDQFEPDQILEQRLANVISNTMANETEQADLFLQALAAPTPAPGGGSAAAYTGAQAAALVGMVAQLTTGKKKYSEVEALMQSTAAQAETLRQQLFASVSADSQAYERVMQAYKLPKDTPQALEARLQAVDEAILGAIQPPLQAAKLAVQTLEAALTVVQHGNLNAISDGATGGALARAALTGAGYNVRINVVSLQDQAPGQPLLDELRQLEQRADEIEAKIRQTLKERGGLSL
jgi:glutamate formiminotransferase/formiminotetrahydrofolate cyclodeaminase